MKGKTKIEKGITLIALIITIVVLLILAAVAISSITNDGILSYATNAASKYNEAQASEQAMLKNYMDYLNTNGSSNEEENGGTDEIPEVTLTLGETTITKKIVNGNTVTATLTATLTNATGTLTWTSSNTSVATVSGSGNIGTVTLKSAGSATITVSYGNYSSTCNITVTESDETGLTKFTLDGATYYAEEEMTWAEWIESPYYSSESGVVLLPVEEGSDDYALCVDTDGNGLFSGMAFEALGWDSVAGIAFVDSVILEKAYFVGTSNMPGDY